MKTIVISGSRRKILNYLNNIRGKICYGESSVPTEIPPNLQDGSLESLWIRFEVDDEISDFDDGELLYEIQET